MRISFLVFMDSTGKSLNKITACEVGVYKGENAVQLLKEKKLKQLYLIDPYYFDNRWLTDDKGNPFSKEEAEKFYEKVKRDLEREKRVVFIKKPSIEASGDFPDGFFDYVYIDADHTYENVKSDLNAWYPKVKRNGVFAGHDSHYPDVRKAIVEFSVMNKLAFFHFEFIRPNDSRIDVDVNNFVDWFHFKN